MYTVKADTKDLSLLDLGRILASFQTNELPRLQKYHNYYENKQAISFKEPLDSGRSNNRVCANYCRQITSSFAGYLTSSEIVYSDCPDKVIDTLKYNDVKNADSDLCLLGLEYGLGVELAWLDENKKIRFKSVDSREAIPVFSDTLDSELLFLIRFFEISNAAATSPTYKVEVYGPSSVKTYLSQSGFSSFQLISDIPHFFGQCPASIFFLNNEWTPVFYPILSLQDAYNNLLSSALNGVDDWAQAYLVFKGAIADAKDLADMKEKRSIQLPDSDSDVSYLTKPANDQEIQDLLTTIREECYAKTACVNFQDENFFNAASGTALKLKMINMEMAAGLYESNLKLALQKRIELISSMISVADGESVWRDVDITFSRPFNVLDASLQIQTVQALRGLVSDETLLGQLSGIVSDVAEEMRKIEEQKQRNLTMYGSGLFNYAEDSTTN